MIVVVLAAGLPGCSGLGLLAGAGILASVDENARMMAELERTYALDSGWVGRVEQ